MELACHVASLILRCAKPSESPPHVLCAIFEEHLSSHWLASGPANMDHSGNKGFSGFRSTTNCSINIRTI